MLQSYRDLFDTLNDKGVKYCIYKGLDHLDEDLSGQRGDIDILVERDTQAFDQVAKDLKFLRVKRSFNWPRFYVKRDVETGQFCLLDVDCAIPFGPKPQTPYRFKINWADIRVTQYKGINVLNEVEFKSLSAMLKILRNEDPNYNMNQLKPRGFFEEVLLNATIRTSHRTLAQTLKRALFGTKIHTNLMVCKQSTLFYLHRAIHLLARTMGRPAYPIRRKGKIVAMIGVDGAGKTSGIDAILNDPFYKSTGIKRIYFGCNEYWIPGILTLNYKVLQIPILNLIVKTILSFDRQTRVLRAVYYKYLGNIVICDRYYYDDDISRKIIYQQEQGKRTLRAFKRRFGGYLKPYLLAVPDLTIFLDVSPDVAYERKQDFSFEEMKYINFIYKDYMKSRPEVQRVNADQPQITVHKQIFLLLSSILPQ